MKKVLYVALILVLVSSVGFAQMAFKGGLNMAKFRGDDWSVTAPAVEKYRTGFAAGASYNIGLLLGLSIQPEVLYVQNGSVVELASSGVSGKATYKVDYIQIPVLVKFAPLPIPVVKPYVEAGVAYSILLSSKAAYDGFFATYAGTSEEDMKDGTATSDLSFVGGIGVDLSLGLITVGVDARYIVGTKSLDKNDSNTKQYNQSIQLTAALAL
jgi:hypothetical protein